MRRALFTTALLLLLPGVLTAQSFLTMGSAVYQSDLLYFAGDAEGAFDLLVRYLESNRTDYDALWRVARAGVVVGISKDDNREQNRYLDPALHYAERAVEAQPDGLDGLYWRGVSAGRRAINASPGRSVELAQVVYDDAHTILRADSLHAGAHNMLGKLNFEVMSLSRFERAVARIFMGNDAIKDTSWEKAEEHLVKAAAISPEFVLFQYDVGALYEKRGRDEEAAPYLEAALALDPVHPIDIELRSKAADLLEKIGH